MQVYTRTVQNTVKAHTLLISKIPEDPTQLRSILTNIEQRNSAQITGEGEKWPNLFVPELTHCKLCSSTLPPPVRVPGSDGRTYLLTRGRLLPVTINIKRCLKCSARYSYSNWREGKSNDYIPFIYPLKFTLRFL